MKLPALHGSLALALLQIIDQPPSATEYAALLARVLLGLAVAYLAYRFVRRLPWPRPFRIRFLLIHMAAAPASGAAWLVLTSAAVTLITGRPFIANLRDVPVDFLTIGTTVYGVVAAVIYLDDATARAFRAEAAVAQTQLATLRAQLQPHFLFNALHTVVQLIPVDPGRAVEAAECVAGLLRTALDEERDAVSLAEEWAFVSRYLELEGIRFGDRLRLSADIDPELLDDRVPPFALQTLVENAVRHGAAPRVAPTDIVVTAAGTRAELALSVRNTGDAGAAHQPDGGTGTGLRRLRERLEVLHGKAARLAYGPLPEGGFEAVLVLPRERAGA
ncbi:MAG TPA: histidine kinase [Longimicrobium sp.]|nr:histidine kinase [Longimicrobium sp.]